MSVGLNVFSPSGNLLIDTEKLYYGLVWSGYATFTGSVYEINIANLQFPVLYVFGLGAIFNIIKNGSVTKFQMIGGYPNGWPNFRNNMASSMVIQLPDDPRPKCYVFDLMRPNKEKFGIEVLSQSGNAVFNSNMSPLNIATSVLPPPVYSTWNYPYTKQGYSQWVFDNNTPASFGEYCSISLANFGLPTSRKYAFHIPWSRGAFYDFFGYRYYLWEIAMTGDNGWICFSWIDDPFSSPSYTGGDYETYIYSLHPNRVAVSLVDVTDMPFPYSY